MSSNIPPGKPTQRRKLLREVKRLSRVELKSGEAAGITALRLKLLANGYVPIPNRDKRTLYTGWNSLDPDAAEIRAWLNDRASMVTHPATGTQIVGELLGLDVDVPDAQMAMTVRLSIAAIAPQLGEAHGALERGRDDGSPKFMLFCRRGSSPPFTIKSGKWSTDPADDDAPTFQIEVFSSERNHEGKVSRQVGAFGPHTVDDETGQIKIRYEWRGPSPAEVPLKDLPILTPEQAIAICAKADEIFAAQGLQQLKSYRSGLIKPTTVYDLDDKSRFDGVEFDEITLAEMIELFWQNEALGLETRCSGSFTGEGGSRKDRCQVGWSGDKATGHITVHDHADETTHRPAIERPVPGDGLEKSIAGLVEMFKDLPPDGDAAPEDEQGTPFGDRLTAAIGQAAADALTEHALALAISGLYKDRLCYVPAEKQWFRFDAPRWVDEPTARIETMIIGTFCRGIPLPRTPAGAKVRKQLEAHRHYSSIEKLMRGLLSYRDGFDKDPYLIAGPLLVVNLRTGKARLGRPKDRIRLSMTNDPSPGEDCPRWKEFISEVTAEPGGKNPDDQVIRFLQQWAGTNLCGDPTHQRASFFYGTGRNGKNTYAEILAELLGNYALIVQFETFVSKKYGSGHPTDIWALKGRRMVVASEVPDGAEWNTARIKGLTGDDTQQARGMNMNFENFTRTWTLSLLGNNMPKFKNVDPAMRSRMRIIPFDRNFELEGLMDEDLKGKLINEGPGILRWAINGFLDAKANKLIEPDRVTAETNAHLDKSDLQKRFVSEYIAADKTADAVPVAEIFELWKSFADASGADPHNERSMSAWLMKLTGAKVGPRIDAVIAGEKKRRIASLTGIKLKSIGSSD